MDARLRQLAADHTEFGQRATRAESRISELETALAEAREAQEPSYAGLGGRASAMLRLAEEEAAEMRVVAQRDADEIREQATRDAQAVKADASRDAEELRIVHTKELDDHRARLMTEAEQERSNAKSEAADLVASAQREADQLRLAAQQEVSELRTGAQREAEQSKAAVDREVQEARRMLAVDRERLAREASEHHTTALAETKRLVEEAESPGVVRRGAGPRGDAAGHRGPWRGADRGPEHPDPRPARG